MPTIAVNTASIAIKKLFDRQVEVLTKAGLALEAELTTLFPLLEQIWEVTEGEGHTPFVIVPQGPNITLSLRMAKVVLDGKTGASYLADNRVTDVDDTPRRHYLCVDVEHGHSTLNTKPSVALAQFKRERCFGGTVIEGISLLMYKPDILRNCFLDLVSSRFDSGLVPTILVVSGKPWLDARCHDLADPNYGSLSCKFRFGIGA